MMLAAIVKKKRISKGFTDDLCSTTVQVDLIVRKDMKKSLKVRIKHFSLRDFFMSFMSNV